MEEEPVAVTEPQSTDDLKQLAGKEKKAAKKKLYSQQHPEPQATQRKLLKDIYIDTKDAAEKKQQLKTACFEIFDSFEGDPLLPFLDLYQRLHDVSLAKTGSLAGCYVHLFSHWMRRSPNQATIKAEYLTLETKKKALEILTAHHAHHALLVGEVFDFTEKESLDFVQNQVEAFIARKKFKEAMDLAAKFQLKPLWPLEAFLLPRVFQDALPEVREYCRDQPQLQTALLAYLDQFVFYDDAVIVAEMRKYCKEREIANCVEKITHKSLMKNIKDLIMTYELESVDRFKAPNYWWATREKSIFYTVKRRFQNATGQYPAIDHTSYVSSIKGFMEGTDEGRKRQLLNTLWNSGDQEQRKDAISWVIIFGMSRYNLPDHVARYMDNYTDEVDKIRELVMRSQLTEDLDSLTCDGIPIRIINSWPALDQILPEIAAAPFLGIDSEWKPQYLAKVDEVALLQLAFSDCVYLIDFVVLEKKLEPEQWAKFFEILLQGDGIKLGFDFINDLRAIFHNQATKEFKEMELKNRNCVCIKLLIENLIEADPDFVDFTDVSSKQLAALATTDPTETVEAVRVLSFKLSTLCEKFLGVRLDKSQQCSDWANRPLTAKQVTYAAKDAHILLQLFDVIRKQAMGKDLQFEEVMKNSMSNCSKKERTKAKKATKKKLDDLSWTEIVDKINDSAVEAYGPGIKATEFVCAVDLMLLGLGKQLRRCGADVYLPVNLADLINTCNKQTKRLILSCGKNAEGLRTQFPNRVMIVSNSNGMDPVNQLKTVFQKMRIRLHKEDIFTRCKECNTLGFIHVPAPVVQALYQSTVVCMNIYHDEPFDQESWRKKLTDIDPQEYEGYGCRVRADPDNFQVDVNQGMVDIIRNMVIYEGGDQPIITQIKHLPENVIRPGRLFYICGTCGKFYWEGRFQENYQDKVADLIATDSAESQEAAAAVCTED